MAVAARLEARQISGAKDFRTRSFLVHVDKDNGHNGSMSDGGTVQTLIPLSDFRRQTAAARTPDFLLGTPITDPGKDPLSRQHGYQVKDVYTKPYPYGRVDRAVQDESASQDLTALENTTLAGIRRKEWKVPGSSQSPDRIKATVFDKNGGSWSVFREATTEPRGRYGEQSSSVVNGSMISLTHTDVKGNVRTFHADVPFTGKGNVKYSEITDGKEINFVNGSHKVESAKLASEFAALDPEQVFLVKNEITARERQQVWTNPTASADVINRLLTYGRLESQDKPQEMEIFDSSKAAGQLAMAGSR